MKYPDNSFTQAIRQGQKQIGLWVSLRDNFAAKAVSTCGYDWLLIDMEHSPNDLATVLTQLDAIESGGSSAIDTVDMLRKVEIQI